MRVCNPEDQGAFESRPDGVKLIMETGGAAREMGTGVCFRAGYVKAKARKNFTKKQVVSNCYQGEKGAWGGRGVLVYRRCCVSIEVFGVGGVYGVMREVTVKKWDF